MGRDDGGTEKSNKMVYFHKQLCWVVLDVL